MVSTQNSATLNRSGSDLITKVLELAEDRYKEGYSPSSIDSLDLAVLLIFYLNRMEFRILKLINGRFVKALGISMLSGFITWTIVNILHLFLGL